VARRLFVFRSRSASPHPDLQEIKELLMGITEDIAALTSTEVDTEAEVERIVATIGPAFEKLSGQVNVLEALIVNLRAGTTISPEQALALSTAVEGLRGVHDELVTVQAPDVPDLPPEDQPPTP
jgi:hypothetical protein